MAQIEWSQEFSIGNATIDREHKLLIAQINQLYEQLSLPIDTEAIETLLTEIQTDISAHFVLEELLMHEVGFAEFEGHKQDHERLLDQIQDMIFHFREDPKNGEELLKNRMSDWFSHHFKSFDARLHDQLG